MKLAPQIEAEVNRQRELGWTEEHDRDSHGREDWTLILLDKCVTIMPNDFEYELDIRGKELRQTSTKKQFDKIMAEFGAISQAYFMAQ